MSSVQPEFEELRGDGIDALVLPTIDSFIEDKWEKTQGITAPKFSQAPYVHPDQEFTVLILLKNYGSEDDQVKVRYTYKIENEVQETVAEGETLGFAGEVPQKRFLLCQNLPTITLGNEAKRGTYKIYLNMIDEITGKEKHLSCRIMLKDFQRKSTVTTEDELEAWSSSYYLSPRPDELIDTFLYFINTVDEEDQYINGIYFFKECVNQSPFLVPHLLAVYKEEEDIAVREGILFLLANTHHAKALSENVVHKKDQEMLTEILEGPFPDSLHEEIMYPEELDFLWAGFFANGRYENIRKLIDMIKYSYTVGTIEKLSGKEKLTEKEERAAMQEAIYEAAKWSLQSMAEKHEFVKIYCMYFLENETTNEALRKDILAIIALT